MKLHHRFNAGVSLIEALIAMAVMGLGMMAVLGLQSTLRMNADSSRQRAEAVRFAQERLEQVRIFSVLDNPSATLPNRSFAESIVTETSAAVSLTGYESSTTFSRNLQVSSIPSTVSTPTATDLYYMPQLKQVVVNVDWTDRNNEAQTVQLSTLISRTAPEIAGSLQIAALGSVASNPGYRNPDVPPQAVDLTGEDAGKSLFTPPGNSGEYWKFNNSTGLIAAICTNPDGTGCTSFNGVLLAGYVRYAVSAGRPDSAQAESPSDTSLGSGITIGVVVHSESGPFPSVAPVICKYDNSPSAFGAYYCAVPTTLLTGGWSWSGRSTVTLNGCWDTNTHNNSTNPLDPNYAADLISPIRCESANAALFAASVSDSSGSKYRVCRYTTRRDNSTVGSGTPRMTNREHPLNYMTVTESLTSQNFLVIKAGDPAATPAAYDCPQDNSSTPLVGTTWHHQPVSP